MNMFRPSGSRDDGRRGCLLPYDLTFLAYDWFVPAPGKWWVGRRSNERNSFNSLPKNVRDRLFENENWKRKNAMTI
jgi:hypothetical protein